MSSVKLSKHPTKQELLNWKVDEIATFLDWYLGDPKVEYLVSAEYELRNLIDGILNKHDPRNPPF